MGGPNSIFRRLRGRSAAPRRTFARSGGAHPLAPGELPPLTDAIPSRTTCRRYGGCMEKQARSGMRHRRDARQPKVPARRRWTAAEKEILKRLYRTHSNAYIAQLVGRSVFGGYLPGLQARPVQRDPAPETYGAGECPQAMASPQVRIVCRMIGISLMGIE